MWLHQMNDASPSKTKFASPEFLVPHRENATGTAARYVPYSTTKSKYFSWVPKITARE